MNKNIVYILAAVLVFAGLVKAQKINTKEWQTKFEKTNYLETSGYDETVKFFKNLEKASPYARLAKFGSTPQGRTLYCLIVSKDKFFTAEQVKKNGKPVVMVINGIHSGEIEGKDASMLLLRNILITKEKEALLDSAVLLVVPVFNVDGHERFSKYNRINQNGPAEMGWRTSAQNLNLNRDWLKADSPEMQAMLKLFSLWLPDFFIDTHTTDGADYQYSLTYGIDESANLYSGTVKWIKEKFIPFMTARVERDGYEIAPYINLKGETLKKGIVEYPLPPRFSHGYTSTQNRTGLLVETHMLKPYKDRVFATYSTLNMALEFVNKNSRELVELNRNADEQVRLDYSINKKAFPIVLEKTDEAENFLFKGVKWIEDTSEISGGRRITYTKEKYDFEIPFYNKLIVKDSVTAPYAYLIPEEWKEIADRLKLHGVRVEELKQNKKMRVERYKFKNVKFQEAPYEGRHLVNCNYDVFNEELIIPSGTYIVATNQRTIRVILQALEPKGADSFLRWGFFNAIFEQKEYFEDYVMEKEAAKMLKENGALKDEFEKKLKEDKDFRANPHKRLAFFYEKSPYFDSSLNLYPIMRVTNKF